jgi:hypothetical protein
MTWTGWRLTWWSLTSLGMAMPAEAYLAEAKYREPGTDSRASWMGKKLLHQLNWKEIQVEVLLDSYNRFSDTKYRMTHRVLPQSHLVIVDIFSIDLVVQFQLVNNSPKNQ